MCTRPPIVSGAVRERLMRDIEDRDSTGSGSLDRPLHEMNPTGRFTERAADYARFRPDYPEALWDAVLEGLGDPASLTAADVGAGTGISSRQLAERGMRVLAVEPNAGMRAAAAPHARVEWRDGTGEHTGLPDAAVDLVVSAQAFHWFRQPEAIAEFHRILRPRGRLAIAWNGRDRRDPVTRGYVEAIHAVGGEHPAERRPFDPAVIHMEHRFTVARYLTFEHHHDMDLEGFVGRAISASYVPKSGPAHDELVRLLSGLFERHRDDRGRVTMRYETRLWLADRTPGGARS